jgi:dipeptidase E
MRLLLTSRGIANASFHDALTGLLGKPIADSTALCLAVGGGAGAQCAAQKLFIR